MSDGTGATSYQYDSLRRLIVAINGAGQKISYKYDLAARLTSITYPNGHSVTRTYDKSGRLVSLTDWLGKSTTFAYNPDGQAITAVYPNKWNGAFSFDDDDLVIGIAYSEAAQKLSLTYKRDTAGRLISESAASSLPPTPPATFPGSIIAYDVLNRCVSDSVSGAGYIYDAADRITNDGGALMSYDTADELTLISRTGHSSPLSYDPEGNRTTASANKLTYDAENRLTAFGTLAKYKYNGDGLRMAKVVGATSELYAWDQRQRNLPVIIQDGTVSYIYGPAQVLVERIDPSNSVTYYHQDQLGSTRLLTNSTGAVVAAYTYDAYGKAVEHRGVGAESFSLRRPIHRL